MYIILISIIYACFKLTHSTGPYTQFNMLKEISGLISACDKSDAPNHFIYCKGPILEAVMAFHLFNDSKTFVDKPLRYAPEVVLNNFNQISHINQSRLIRFIDDNFEMEGTELKRCKLDDWTDKPLALLSISDRLMREFALKLHLIWKVLCREIDIKVFLNENRYSMLYLPNQFVISGGRFREYYYWDGLFILKGLLASGLFGTARGMIENYLYLVSKYGFVPNGGRIYYLGRSQPPVLISMVYEYYLKTKEIEFLTKNIHLMEKEINFWDNNRNISIEISGDKYHLYQYRAKTNSPRPESFWEDIQLVKQMTKNEEKKRIWKNIASAAESGWDFSSRWLSDPHELSSIQTTDIIPADLNAFICWNFNILAFLFHEIGNVKKADEYRLKFGRFRSIFEKVFYVHNESGWFDYNWKKQRHNFDFYPSMAVPLFSRCYDPLNSIQVERVYERMDEMGAFKYVGGIPASLIMNTNQQWDYPNGWAPLNYMVIQGLRQSDSPKLQEKAFLLAQKWILNNYRVFQKTGVMWEKYSVSGNSPEAGSGGEYTVQAGFGWTNGVILDLLTTYGNRLDFSLLSDGAKSLAYHQIPSILIILTCLLIY